MTLPSATPTPPGQLNANGKRRLLTVVLLQFFYALLLFASAGTLAWPAAWAYSIASLLSLGIGFLVLRHQPEVINARGERQQGQKTWDKWLMALLAPLVLSQMVVAGLDAGRWQGASMAWGWRALGWVLWAGSTALIYGTMANNPFLATTVRIQTERQHQAVDRGPYRYVRHPMYLAMLVGWIGLPLLLGSWWALAPGALCWALLVVRTAREDRTLQAELEGYAAYAARVRYRLLPGVW